MVPAAFALLGLAGAAAARAAAIKLMPFLIVLSGLLLGRAHYLIHVRRQGRRWSRRIVWGATVLVVGLWLPRLL